MIHPDKELWDKVPFDEKYEYIPIPTAVAKILKRKVKDKYGEKILLCHWYQDKPTDEKSIIMHYVRWDGYHLYRANVGYSFSIFPRRTLNESLLKIAQEIAKTWPEYAVKKRKKYKTLK